MSDSPSRMIVLFSSDLMLISSVGGAATSSGHRFCSVSRLHDALQALSDEQAMLCLDLSAPEGDPQAIAIAVPNEVLQRSVAFGPHVHTAKLDQARLAGFPRVMSRGQFVSRLAQLF